MDIIEYAEKVCGRELSNHEKMTLRFYSKLPKGAVLVMGRSGPMWFDKDGNRLDPKEYLNSMYGRGDYLRER